MNFKDIIAKHAMANGINWRAKTKAEPQELDKSEELAKGANGDWEKEGYTLKHEIYPHKFGGDEIHVTAHHNGKEVGSLKSAPSSRKPGHIYPMKTDVEPEHQRKGLANAMYAHAEKHLGMKMTPGGMQSDDAKALWANKNKPFGKSLAKSENKSQVSTVAVFDGTKMLMGKRQDTGKITNPGGHLDKNEDPKDGAIRELFEEAGIKADDLEYLGSEKVTTYTGKEKTIHCYRLDLDEKTKTTSKNDPDEEVARWQWIETKGGLPEGVASNLHSPDNILLQKLGLQKKKDVVADKIQKSLARIRDLLKSNDEPKVSKERKAGHLTAGGGWKVHSFHNIDDASAHGSASKHEICAHCKKPIKNVVTINHGDYGQHSVGEDCASALVSGEAKTKLDGHIKKEKDKSKQIKEIAGKMATHKLGEGVPEHHNKELANIEDAVKTGKRSEGTHTEQERSKHHSKLINHKLSTEAEKKLHDAEIPEKEHEAVHKIAARHAVDSPAGLKNNSDIASHAWSKIDTAIQHHKAKKTKVQK